MKKLFLLSAVVAVMSLGLSSCNKGAQCWEIGTKVPIFGFVPTDAFYGTASEAEAYIKETYGTSVGLKKQKSDKSEADCKSWTEDVLD